MVQKQLKMFCFFVSYTKFWPLLFVVVTPIFTIVGDVKCWRIWLLFLLLNRTCIVFLYIFIGKINKRLDLLRHSSVCIKKLINIKLRKISILALTYTFLSQNRLILNSSILVQEHKQLEELFYGSFNESWHNLQKKWLNLNESFLKNRVILLSWIEIMGVI